MPNVEVFTAVRSKAVEDKVITSAEVVDGILILHCQDDTSIEVELGASGGVGPEGPEGPIGPAGADGADGADGAPGADGVDAPNVVTSNTQTVSYVLVLSDAGKVIEMNVAGANTLTIPLNASEAFPIGTVIEVYQMGAGQVTITPTSGVTLQAPHGAKTSVQYASVSLRKRATDEWVLAGDTST